MLEVPGTAAGVHGDRSWIDGSRGNMKMLSLFGGRRGLRHMGLMLRKLASRRLSAMDLDRWALPRVIIASKVKCQMSIGCVLDFGRNAAGSRLEP